MNETYQISELWFTWLAIFAMIGIWVLLASLAYLVGEIYKDVKEYIRMKWSYHVGSRK